MEDENRIEEIKKHFGNGEEGKCSICNKSGFTYFFKVDIGIPISVCFQCFPEWKSNLMRALFATQEEGCYRTTIGEKSPIKYSVWRTLMVELYANYMASRQWRDNRKACLDRNKGKCEFCKKDANVAHHTSYDRWALGEDELNDLIPVCDSHHAKEQCKVETPFWAKREPRLWYFPKDEWHKIIEKIPTIGIDKGDKDGK